MLLRYRAFEYDPQHVSPGNARVGSLESMITDFQIFHKQKVYTIIYYGTQRQMLYCNQYIRLRLMPYR